MLNTGVPNRSKSFREKARERFGFSRNKSRSVDVKRPSTLSSIRSKIQTVSASIKDTVASLPEDIDVDPEFKSGRTSRSSVPTVDHKVRPGETLSSIAAQFDTTPSELCSLNRLSLRTVFADQVIRVPDPEVRAKHLAAIEAAKKEEEMEKAASKLANSPRAGPGLAARVLASPGSPDLSFDHPESVHERQFVKSEKAKLITWGEGVVSGVLIVTPQSLMFDPGYSDPLVMERGHVYFQIHIDLVEVISVSVYKDPRAMKLLAPADLREEDSDDSPSQSEVLLHLGVSDETAVEKQSSSRPETPASPDLSQGETEEAEKKEEECEKKEEVEENEAGGETDPPPSSQPINVAPNSAEDKYGFTLDDASWHQQLDSFIPRPSRHYDDAPVYMCIRHRPASGRNRTYKSCRMNSNRSVGSSGSNNSGIGAIAGTGKEEERLPDRGQHWFSIPQESARELFTFLRRSGVSSHAEEEGSASSIPQRLRPDSQSDGSLNVFSLDDTGENEAYFVVHEHHYGESPNVTTPEIISAAAENELSNSVDGRHVKKLRAIRQESLDWELISRSELQSASGTSPGGSHRQETLDEDFPLPTLIGKTLMLTDDKLRDLMRNLPTRAEGCLNMRLSYSTSQHGFSLATLYRRCKREIEDRPCIILVSSQGATEGTCFGAILSHSMHFSDHYYGNGETRLVKWNPELEIADWSGENNYILKGGCKTYSVGSSNGRVALWLDEDLYRGRSQICETFNMREPLTHDGKEDFIIENLEVWTFH